MLTRVTDEAHQRITPRGRNVMEQGNFPPRIPLILRSWRQIEHSYFPERSCVCASLSCICIRICPVSALGSKIPQGVLFGSSNLS
jgi:hypothetical protein